MPQYNFFTQLEWLKDKVTSITILPLRENKHIPFISSPENIKKFNPYSPEYHDVIRCGKGVSCRPNLDSGLYNQLLDSHKEDTFPLSSNVVEYVSSVVNTANINEFKIKIRSLPEAEGSIVDFLEAVLRASYTIYNTVQDIGDGEAMFNDILLFPFLKAVCTGINIGVPQFKVGETRLNSLTVKVVVTDHDDSTFYLADGTISLYGFAKVEVLILETSIHFGSRDNSKSSFDHHKALFGSLSMLKAIANTYCYGSTSTFKKVKVFFVHAAEKTVRLWSMRYVPEGPLFELWLEQTVCLDTSFEQRQEQVPLLIKFYWSLKCLIEETIENLEALKKEHMKIINDRLLTSCLPKSNLSTTVNCSMLKLTEEEDKSGMFRLGPFYTA